MTRNSRSEPWIVPSAAGAVAAGQDLRRPQRGRPVGEDVVGGERHRPVDVALRVLERELARGRPRRAVLRVVLDAQEHGEPGLVGLEVAGRGGQADEVGAVLGVRRVELARDLHLVLQAADVRVHPLGDALARVGPVLGAAGAEGAGEDGEEGEQDEGAQAHAVDDPRGWAGSGRGRSGTGWPACAPPRRAWAGGRAPRPPRGSSAAGAGPGRSAAAPSARPAKSSSRRSVASLGSVATARRTRVAPSPAASSSQTARVRTRLYLPVRPAATIRHGRSTSMRVRSPHGKRCSGARKRNRAPAPRPSGSSRVRCQSTMKWSRNSAWCVTSSR